MTGEFPAQGACKTRKMLPFDDVIVLTPKPSLVWKSFAIIVLTKAVGSSSGIWSGTLSTNYVLNNFKYMSWFPRERVTTACSNQWNVSRATCQCSAFQPKLPPVVVAVIPYWWHTWEAWLYLQVGPQVCPCWLMTRGHLNKNIYFQFC